MDPMDFVLHGGPSRAPTHYDPVHAASGHPWMHHPQSSQQSYPWISAHPQDAALPLGLQRPHQMPEHFQHGPGGGGLLPPPGPGFRGMPGPDAHSGLSMPVRNWPQPIHQMSGMPPGPPQNLSSSMGMPNESTFGFPPSGSRGLWFHDEPRPAAQSSGPAGVTSEHLQPSTRWSSANAFGGQQNTSSHASMPPLPFSSSPHRHTAHHHHHSSSTSTSSHRNSHAAFPQPSFSHLSHHSISALPQAPSSDRRRSGHARGRRSMASRMSASEPLRDDDDLHGRGANFEATPPGEVRRNATHNAHHLAMLENDVRQMQMMRGLTTNKMVASKVTMKSLHSIEINDLPATERTCVICYNDYGVETPEGVKEAPLQLPKCKHVFGDHCIKKWFEDSDSCPYCRDKLPSEPKRNVCSARAFMAAMRVRGLSDSAQEELWARAMVHSSQYLDAEILAAANPGAERHAAPSDGADPQRRTRARRSDSSIRQSSPPPADDENMTTNLGERHTRRRVQWSEESMTDRRNPPDYAFLHPDIRQWPHPEHLGGVFRAPYDGLHAQGDGHDGLQRALRDQDVPNPLRVSDSTRPQVMPENSWEQQAGGADNRPTESRSGSTGQNHRASRPW